MSDVGLPLKHRFAADVIALPLARILVRHWLQEHEVDGDSVFDVLVVANELCTHAVLACKGGSCELQGRAEPGRVALEVVGHRRQVPEGVQPSHLAPGSAPRTLVEHLGAGLSIADEGSDVRVRCTCKT